MPVFPAARRGLALSMTAAVILLLAALLSAPLAQAATPLTLTHSGRIVDGNNNLPLEGHREVTFSLYTESLLLWQETQQVSFSDGYYSALLGSDTVFVPSDFEQPELSLGMALAGEDEFTPRLAFSSVPYALQAENATGDISPRTISVNGRTVINASGEWVGAQTNLVGPQGLQGAQGEAGPVGVQGPQGAAGPQGVAGAQGTQGDAGPAGSTGPTGPTGPAGQQGNPGLQGIQGPPGVISAATLTPMSCSGVFTCVCPANTLMMTGGGVCAQDQTLLASHPVPGSTTCWTATCEIFQTGVDVAPLTIYLICAGTP